MIARQTVFQWTAAELVAQDFEEKPPAVEGFMESGEVVLFIAQEKAGKSTLVRQLALDFCRGDKFLGRFATLGGIVLHIEYENRPPKIKRSLLRMSNGRAVPDNYHVRAFHRLLDRDVGLEDKGNNSPYSVLTDLCRAVKPNLLILDPLRLAVGRKAHLNEDKDLVELVELAQALVADFEDLTVIIVHHTRKCESDDVSLSKDPTRWISRVYGGQALLASVESILGLEKDEDDLFVFATIQRNLPNLKVILQQDAETLRFELCDDDVLADQAFTTGDQKKLWASLSDLFARQQADDLATGMGMSRGLVNRVIRNGEKAGLLKREDRGVYQKVRKATADE